MADATNDDNHVRGEMDISAQRREFSVFLKMTEWGTVLLVMLLGMIVMAFAIGAGWMAGVAVWAALGVLFWAAMKMGPAWMATVIVSTVLFGLGGLIASLF
jgi:hypothetical protein